MLHKGRLNFLFWLTVMSICLHFYNSTIRSKMLLNVRTFKRYEAWLAFVHLGFTLNPRFMTAGLGDWSMWFIEDVQNSWVEKEVLLRSGWYECVLSLVVLCLWDAKSMIVSLCIGCRKGHQKIQKRLKVSSSCSQPEYRNSLKRWALNFLYIYIHICFHIPVYIFIFLPNLVSSWKRTLLSEKRVIS